MYCWYSLELTYQSWARQEDLWIKTFLQPLLVTFVFCGHHKWCEFFIWFKWWRIETTLATRADRSWEKNALICGSRVMLGSPVGLFSPRLHSGSHAVNMLHPWVQSSHPLLWKYSCHKRLFCVHTLHPEPWTSTPKSWSIKISSIKEGRGS